VPTQRYASIVDVRVIWVDPARLPPDVVGYATTVITAEHGLTFTRNGW
jgi:hypothetical protein